MSFSKQIKKNIDLIPNKVGLARRQEMLEEIQQDGTFLPKSVLHADLDRGFLDFVKDKLGFSVDGKAVPVVDIIVTTQNWAQFTQTWKFQDLDKNASPPFVTVIRSNDMKYGTNPSLQYTIPVRKEFFYAYVPTFDGQRSGVDVYQIPQPIPIDIKYTLKFICNRVREVNQLNKVVLENFSSRQAYTKVKGHYIPIVWDNVSDESVMEIEKRKYYIVSYDFTMLGFLIDEDEFKVKPGISRVLQLFEFQTDRKTRGKRTPPYNPNRFYENINFPLGVNSLGDLFPERVDLKLLTSDNIESYEVYINNLYYGSNVNFIQINSGDSVRFDVVRTDDTLTSTIKFQNTLI
jgi:hypothetical protein